MYRKDFFRGLRIPSSGGLRVFLLWCAVLGGVLVMSRGGELTAQVLLPPEEFEASDTPNDAGKSISLTWKKSPQDSEGLYYVIDAIEDEKNLYAVSPPELGSEAWVPVVRMSSIVGYKSDAPQYFGVDPANENYHFFEFTAMGPKRPIKKGVRYFFRLGFVGESGEPVYAPVVKSAVASDNWFNRAKVNILVAVILLSGIVIFFVRLARKNPNLFVRRIGGLDAIEEAIGRATEMGKPVLYLSGMTGVADLSTIAAISILGKVASRVAAYDSGIKVPCRDPIVMLVSQETVKQAYANAGRLDAFRQDDIFFVTDDQFAYVAAVDGLMLRERPAANLYMGFYYAESLLLSETGCATGAIQIAGTDSITQLPFFIVTCDYTLMGEELYAASAYLSREPLQLGSLKGSDVVKVLILVALVVGTALSTGGIQIFSTLLRTF